MESVKSIVKDVVYGKSKIHTNMEFTFSNNKYIFLPALSVYLFFFLCYNKFASVTFRYFLFLHKSNYNMNGNSMLFYFLLSGHFILQFILLVFRQKRRTPASKHKKSSKMKETCSFLIF